MGQRGKGAGERLQVWFLCPWEGYVGVGSSYHESCRCWPCSLSSPLLWWRKRPWWFGSRVGGITRVSLSGCQMDKTSGWVVLCHQEEGFQVWAKVVLNLLFFLFYLPLSILSVLVGQGSGRSRTGELGEMGRSNDLPKYLGHCCPCRPHLLLFLLIGEVGRGRRYFISGPQ